MANEEVNNFGKDQDAELGMHPTDKPILRVAHVILGSARQGNIALDDFAENGTTLVAT